MTKYLLIITELYNKYFNQKLIREREYVEKMEKIGKRINDMLNSKLPLNSRFYD